MAHSIYEMTVLAGKLSVMASELSFFSNTAEPARCENGDQSFFLWIKAVIKLILGKTRHS